VREHSHVLWTLLMFDAFLRNAMDARETASPLKVAV